MIKRGIIIVAMLAILLACATATVSNFTYEFKHAIGDMVEYDNNEWEIRAILEMKHIKNNVIYPWYMLMRSTENNYVEKVWLWAPIIDFPQGAPESDPPPDCRPLPPPC